MWKLNLQCCPLTEYFQCPHIPLAILSLFQYISERLMPRLRFKVARHTSLNNTIQLTTCMMKAKCTMTNCSLSNTLHAASRTVLSDYTGRSQSNHYTELTSATGMRGSSADRQLEMLASYVYSTEYRDCLASAGRLSTAHGGGGTLHQCRSGVNHQGSSVQSGGARWPGRHFIPSLSHYTAW